MPRSAVHAGRRVVLTPEEIDRNDRVQAPPAPQEGQAQAEQDQGQGPRPQEGRQAPL